MYIMGTHKQQNTEMIVLCCEVCKWTPEQQQKTRKDIKDAGWKRVSSSTVKCNLHWLHFMTKLPLRNHHNITTHVYKDLNVWRRVLWDWENKTELFGHDDRWYVLRTKVKLADLWALSQLYSTGLAALTIMWIYKLRKKRGLSLLKCN